MTRFFLLSLTTCLVLLLGAAKPVSDQQLRPITPTTVCDLSANPERYANLESLVRVRAFILSDLKHSTLLADAECEKAGVSLQSGDFKDRPIDLVNDTNYKKLEELHPRIPELLRKGQKVYGTFEGLFQWHPENAPRGPLRILVLRQVTDLHVGERDDPKYALRER